MLKKAGIVVAGSAAALLALSPLAFAGESGHWGHHPSGNKSSNQVNYIGDSGSRSTGLVAIGDINALNNVNICPPIAAGLGIGDILGVLSPGTASVPVRGGSAVCVNDNSVSQSNDR